MRALIAGLFLFLIGGGVFSASITAPIIKGQGSSSVYMFQEVIPTSSYLEKTFYDIAGYDNLSVYIAAASAGSITTANAIWVMPYRGATSTLRSENIYADGRPYHGYISDVLTVRIYSNHAATVRVTGNIMLRKAASYPKRAKTQFSLAVGTTLTTYTVTDAQQGFWNMRPSQDILINFVGGTNDLYSVYANEPLAFDVYLKKGDTIRAKARTTTTNVKVLADE